MRRGLAKRAEEWKGSSVRESEGVDADEPESRCGLEIGPAGGTRICGKKPQTCKAGRRYYLPDFDTLSRIGGGRHGTQRLVG